MRRGKVTHPEEWLMAGAEKCHRYKVPINAVDTHREKPTPGPEPNVGGIGVPLDTTARKYFDDSVGANPR